MITGQEMTEVREETAGTATEEMDTGMATAGMEDRMEKQPCKMEKAMRKKIWLIAGIAGMLLGMPQSTVQAEYRGDRYEERGPRHDYEYSRYHRHHRPRYDDRIWIEREDRRRRWREEERRRHHHHHDHRSGVYIRL